MNTVTRPTKAKRTQHDRSYRPHSSEARRAQNRRSRRVFKQKLQELMHEEDNDGTDD